jgi:hypothetical protein
MTSSASTDSWGPPADAAARPDRFGRTVLTAAVVASAALVGLGLVWLLAPELDPFRIGQMSSLVSAFWTPGVVAGLTLGLGVAGIALALLTARIGRNGDSLAPGLAAAALAVAAGLTLGSMGIIAVAGYLFGLVAVVAGVVTIAVMIVRAPRLGLLLLAGLVGLGAMAFWLAGLTLDGILKFATAFAGALAAEVADIAVAAVVVGVTVAWVAVAIRLLRRSPATRHFERWLVRHRRALTVLAALGPVPYAVARASWVTPWPLFGTDAANIPPDMLTTGLMLGAGAVAASILTLGLILPWGRVFPRWIPGIGGRPVPVAAAVVPGALAAGVISVSAAPVLVTTTADDALLVNLVLPLWFWGPMLALAVWAYAAWRRDEVDGR